MITLGFTPNRVLVWVVGALAGVVVGSFLPSPWNWVVPVVVAVLWLGLTVAEFRGATVSETIRRARATEKPYRPVRLQDVDGTAVLLEDDVVSVWLEVLPGEDVDVTEVHADGSMSRPTLDVSKIAGLLRQADVTIDTVAVTTLSYATYLPTYTAGNAVVQAVGRQSLPLGGRTWINVRATVVDNVDAAESRGSGDFDKGMISAVLAAVARLRIVIEEGGHAVRFLSPEMIAQVSSMVTAGTGKVLDNSQRSKFVSPRTKLRGYALYPVRPPRRAAVAEWSDIPSVRMFTTTTLRPETSHGAARVSDRVLTISADDAALSTARKLGLAVLTRQQRQAATWVIPSVVSQDVVQPDYGFTEPHPVVHYGGGIGALVGKTTGASTVFISIRPGTGKTVHIIGPAETHRVMILRLLMEAHSINVQLPADSPATAAWESFAAKVKSPLFAVNSEKKSDIIITDANGLVQAKADPSQCVIVTSLTPPDVSLENSIVVSGTHAVVTTPTVQHTVSFTPSPSEMAFAR